MLESSRTRKVAVPGETALRIRFVLLETVTEATVLGEPVATIVTVSNLREDRKLLGLTVMSTKALIPSQKATRIVVKVAFTTCSVAVSLATGHLRRSHHGGEHPSPKQEVKRRSR